MAGRAYVYNGSAEPVEIVFYHTYVLQSSRLCFSNEFNEEIAAFNNNGGWTHYKIERDA